MSVGSVGSTGPLFMASTPTITGPRPSVPETPQITPVSNPNAFQSTQAVGNSTLGATTAKDEVCKAVDGCETPDGSVPDLDSETTGMEGMDGGDIDGDFADATGESLAVEGGSDGTEEVSEGGEADETEETGEADETDEAEGSEETSEADGDSEVSDADGGGDVAEADGGGEVAEAGGDGTVGESDGDESEGDETSPGAETQAGAAGVPATASQPGSQPGGAEQTAADGGGDKPIPVGGLISKTALTVSRGMNALGEYNKAPDARQGLVKPMPPVQGSSPGGNVSGAKLNTTTAVGTARHISNLADGNFTGSDVVAAGELASTAAGALHTRQGSEATARLVQRAGGVAAGAGIAGFAVNLATQDYSKIGSNISALASDPGNANLQSQAAADIRGVGAGVQDVVNAARGAVPTLEAAKGTLGTATTTAGRIAERAAGPAAHAAATASRAVGRLAPGVNIAVAAMDTAVAASDISKAMKNPTRDNVVNAGLSSIVAAGSIAAASNVPVVSQVGAAVSMAGDAAKLVYNNRAAIGKAASSAASAVGNAASSAASTVRNAASNAASAATTAVSNKANQAYAWAKSWF